LGGGFALEGKMSRKMMLGDPPAFDRTRNDTGRRCAMLAAIRKPSRRIESPRRKPGRTAGAVAGHTGRRVIRRAIPSGMPDGGSRTQSGLPPFPSF
jgi:hypothetical protein